MSSETQGTLTEEELDRFLGSSVGTAHDDRLIPYLNAAAVLVAFDPDSLQPAYVGTAVESERPAVRDRLASLSELIDEGPQRGLWSLSFTERRDAMRRLGSREAMRKALEANPERFETPVQRMFERIVNRKPLLLEKLTRSDLAALISVIGWVDNVLESLPDLVAVRSALTKADLLAPMQRLVDRGFVDRLKQLSQIHDYVFDDDKLPAPLFVFGPGGIGKSTVLAKFILDSVQKTNLSFGYIDLDRPTVRPDRPLTLLLEAVRQLQIQFNLPLHVIDPIIKELVYAKHREELGRHRESVSLPYDYWLDQISPLLPPGHSVIIVDTFEEAQYMGPSVVWSLVDFLFSLARLEPMRIIVAGRALPLEYIKRAFPDCPAETLASSDTWAADDWVVQSIPLRVRPVNLGVLDEGSARDLLRNSTQLADLAPLSDKDLDDVIGIVGRNPMCLNLAARLIRDQGVDKLRQAGSEFLTKLKAEKIQALLYGRILHHVHGDDVRKVAYPGLIVRRVTPDVIREVLAAPCGLKLTQEHTEYQIFEDLAKEAALVERDPMDGSLRHRYDVRREMLADLTDHVEPEVIERIDKAAVAYYADQPGAINRAEELYHRLRLREPESLLDQRWLPDAELGLRLKGAVEELAPKQRLWLAEKLGISLSPAVRQQADQEEWEQQAAREADRYLSLGLASQALAVLRERSERLPRSALYALEAEALRFLEDFDQALAVARSGVEAASKAGAIDMVLELLLKMVVIEESREQFSAAETLLNEAAAVAVSSRDAMLRLRINVTRLRVQRQLYPEDRDQRRRLREEVVGTITEDILHKLRAHPVLLREVAAELGKEDARIAEAALNTLGIEVATDAQANSLAQALNRLKTAQATTQHPPIDLGSLIEQYEEHNSDPDIIRQWVTKELTSTDARTLSKVIGTYEKGSDVLRTFREYFRSGVDTAMKGAFKK